ncbi:hypothetical protein [Oceanisphaera pacifica]|uniref:Uncharacterized protein n=1 Tax=Oceanisphaera pacifica TaxID=2818389 RepID=A0ABS3NGR2_9GAMM|nr:hypothetical protein [Oceanisphaera pacifica]MBO1519465.1 hypothetical protein [Oceanisphaera pacifica]
MDNKQEYLAYLQTTFRDYFADASHTAIEREQSKSFINGLMVAGKIFGVTSEELQQVLSREQSHRVGDSSKVAITGQDALEVPAYIRFAKQEFKQ